MTEPDPLQGFAPPRAPSALREPVLRAARAALDANADEPTIWALLWRRRWLRLGWAGACMLLVAGHVALTLRPQRRPAASRRAIVAIYGAPSPEMRDVLSLPATERLAAGLEPGPKPFAGDAKAVPSEPPRKGR